MYNPYNRGKWYQVTLSSDGKKNLLNKTDIPNLIMESDKLKIPKKFHVVDVKYDIVPSVKGDDKLFTPGIYVSLDGNLLLPLPSKKNYEVLNISIFGY